ncbi:MAG TPA: histidinol dehydrogenase [Syntrophales bacterium]|nr:histidinol dehydrogenase [Syntrophales bacterium]
MIRVIHTGDKIFEETFFQIKRRGKLFNQELWAIVQGIVEDVVKRGDEALFAYTEKFDGVSLNAQTVEASSREIEAALGRVSKEDLRALKLAAERIEKFHLKQETPDLMTSEEGIELGQRVLPLERVGIYAPGGSAVYPSTVLMAAIPARIAGVEEMVLVTPCKSGELNPLIAAAAGLGGVARIFKIGGAQAIAALAYGTKSVPAVDKIVGPGNAYVAAAKKMVYGQVAIDMIAGPSEVLVIADGTAVAAHAAADLLAQAEHDVMASAVLLTPLEALARQVAGEVEKQLPELSRRAVAKQSIEDFGALIVTRDMEEAIAIANRFAPEHLELMVADFVGVLKKVRNAGAAFQGGSTPETLGDYLAGPNHILPTGGTARFSSPLGVYDFVKRTNVLCFSREALQKYGAAAAHLAGMEGFDAHARSVTIRMKGKTS